MKIRTRLIATFALLSLPNFSLAQSQPPNNGQNEAVITSEELRLSAIDKEANETQFEGKMIKVVGKIRSISATTDGNATINFTNVEAHFLKEANEQIAQLNRGDYITFECTVRNDEEAVFIQLINCANPVKQIYVTADDYFNQYENNQIRADSLFNNKYIIISGIYRMSGTLNDGRHYIGIKAAGDFAEVTAILEPSMYQIANDYIKESPNIELYCNAGYRFNAAGTVGLSNCKFLTAY
ncbi:MAG: hypothetical protein FD163_2491 [Hyphomonadaceae bacterium]|nr:MAG: hypothetical protein FD163_2491 [Hyphomonadaceae bacterium]